jgi:hypothetical protein
MKSTALFALALLALSQIAPSKDRSPNVIEDYEEVLAHVPAKLQEAKPTGWTEVQRLAANEALKKALIDPEPRTRAKLRLTVKNIANWGGLTFFAEIPNKQGYHIRVFGKFTEDWKRRLATLKKGDSAVLEGDLRAVMYEDVWGQFTLSICLKDCSFTRDSPDPIKL